MSKNTLTKRLSTNDETSRDYVKKRSLFDEVRLDYINIIDLWEEKSLYGKLTLENDVVLPQKKSLSPIDSKNKALSFVSRAFVDMARRYTALAAQGAVRASGVPSRLDIQRGWVDGEDSYRSHLNSIKLSMPEILSRKFYRDTVEYFKEFRKYLLEAAKVHAITLTSYVASGFCPTNVSGLVIEIDVQPYGNHQISYQDYYLSENFDTYQRTALDFGFSLDQNAPWRLIADLQSPSMRSYMENEGITFANLFQDKYDTTYNRDFRHLKDLFQDSYELSLGLKSFVFKNGKNITRCDYEPLDIPDTEWYDFYVRLRMAEENKVLNYKLLLKKVKEIKKKELGNEFTYINWALRRPILHDK